MFFVSRRRVALRAALTIRHGTGISFGIAYRETRTTAEESRYLGLVELPLNVQVEERSKLIKHKK